MNLRSRVFILISLLFIVIPTAYSFGSCCYDSSATQTGGNYVQFLSADTCGVYFKLGPGKDTLLPEDRCEDYKRYSCEVSSTDPSSCEDGFGEDRHHLYALDVLQAPTVIQRLKDDGLLDEDYTCTGTYVLTENCGGRPSPPLTSPSSSFDDVSALDSDTPEPTVSTQEIDISQIVMSNPDEFSGVAAPIDSDLLNSCAQAGGPSGFFTSEETCNSFDLDGDPSTQDCIYNPYRSGFFSSLGPDRFGLPRQIHESACVSTNSIRSCSDIKTKEVCTDEDKILSVSDASPSRLLENDCFWYDYDLYTNSLIDLPNPQFDEQNGYCVAAEDFIKETPPIPEDINRFHLSDRLNVVKDPSFENPTGIWVPITEYTLPLDTSNAFSGTQSVKLDSTVSIKQTIDYISVGSYRPHLYVMFDALTTSEEISEVMLSITIRPLDKNGDSIPNGNGAEEILLLPEGRSNLAEEVFATDYQGYFAKVVFEEFVAPRDTRSIEFEIGVAGPVSVYIDGVNLEYSPPITDGSLDLIYKPIELISPEASNCELCYDPFGLNVCDEGRARTLGDCSFMVADSGTPYEPDSTILNNYLGRGVQGQEPDYSKGNTYMQDKWASQALANSLLFCEMYVDEQTCTASNNFVNSKYREFHSNNDLCKWDIDWGGCFKDSDGNNMPDVIGEEIVALKETLPPIDLSSYNYESDFQLACDTIPPNVYIYYTGINPSGKREVITSTSTTYGEVMIHGYINDFVPPACERFNIDSSTITLEYEISGTKYTKTIPTNQERLDENIKEFFVDSSGNELITDGNNQITLNIYDSSGNKFQGTAPTLDANIDNTPPEVVFPENHYLGLTPPWSYRVTEPTLLDIETIISSDPSQEKIIFDVNDNSAIASCTLTLEPQNSAVPNSYYEESTLIDLGDTNIVTENSPNNLKISFPITNYVTENLRLLGDIYLMKMQCVDIYGLIGVSKSIYITVDLETDFTLLSPDEFVDSATDSGFYSSATQTFELVSTDAGIDRCEVRVTSEIEIDDGIMSGDYSEISPQALQLVPFEGINAEGNRVTINPTDTPEGLTLPPEINPPDSTTVYFRKLGGDITFSEEGPNFVLLTCYDGPNNQLQERDIIFYYDISIPNVVSHTFELVDLPDGHHNYVVDSNGDYYFRSIGNGVTANPTLKIEVDGTNSWIKGRASIPSPAGGLEIPIEDSNVGYLEYPDYTSTLTFVDFEQELISNGFGITENTPSEDITQYSFPIRLTDKAGNTHDHTVTYYVDASTPTLTFEGDVRLQPGTTNLFTSEPNPTITLNFNSPSHKQFECSVEEVLSSGASFTPRKIGPVNSIDFELTQGVRAELSQGRLVELTLTCTDQFGVEVPGASSETYTLHFDNIPPRFVDFSVANGNPKYIYFAGAGANYPSIVDSFEYEFEDTGEVGYACSYEIVNHNNLFSCTSDSNLDILTPGATRVLTEEVNMVNLGQAEDDEFLCVIPSDVSSEGSREILLRASCEDLAGNLATPPTKDLTLEVIFTQDLLIDPLEFIYEESGPKAKIKSFQSFSDSSFTLTIEGGDLDGTKILEFEGVPSNSENLYEYISNSPIDLTNIDSGTYTVRAEGEDGDFSIGRITGQLVVDKNIPTAVVNVPNLDSDGKIFSTAFVVEFEAEDVGTGFREVDVLVNGQSVYLITDGGTETVNQDTSPFGESIAFDLSTGDLTLRDAGDFVGGEFGQTYTFTLRVVDKQLNEFTSEPVTVEIAAPTLSFEGDVNQVENGLYTNVVDPNINVLLGSTGPSGTVYRCILTPGITGGGTVLSSTFTVDASTPSFDFRLSSLPVGATSANLQTLLPSIPITLQFDCVDFNEEPVPGAEGDVYTLYYDNTPPSFVGLDIDSANPIIKFNLGSVGYPSVSDSLVFEFDESLDEAGYLCEYKIVNSNGGLGASYSCSSESVSVQFTGSGPLHRTADIVMVDLNDPSDDEGALCSLSRTFTSTAEVDTSFTIEGSCTDFAGNPAPPQTQRVEVGLHFTRDYLVEPLEFEFPTFDEAVAVVKAVDVIPNLEEIVLSTTGSPVDGVTFSYDSETDDGYHLYKSTPIDISGFTTGTYSYLATATAQGFEVGSVTGSLEIDDTKPSNLIISVPEAINGVVYGTKFTVEFSSNDNTAIKQVDVMNEGSSGIYTHVRGTDPPSPNSFIEDPDMDNNVYSIDGKSHSGYIVTKDPTPEGTYTLELVVLDEQGNSATAQTTVELRKPGLTFGGEVTLFDSTFYTSVINPEIEVIYNTQEAAFSYSCDIILSSTSGSASAPVNFPASDSTKSFSFKLSDILPQQTVEDILQSGPMNINFDCRDVEDNLLLGSGDYFIELDTSVPSFESFSIQGSNPKFRYNSGSLSYPSITDIFSFEFTSEEIELGFQCEYEVTRTRGEDSLSCIEEKRTLNFGPGLVHQSDEIVLFNLGQASPGTALCDVSTANFNSASEIEIYATIEATCADLAGNRAINSPKSLEVGAIFTEEYLVDLAFDQTLGSAVATVTSTVDILSLSNPTLTLQDSSGDTQLSFTSSGANEAGLFEYTFNPIDTSSFTTGTYTYIAIATSDGSEVGFVEGNLEIDRTPPNSLLINVPGESEGVYYGSGFSVIIGSQDEDIDTVIVELSIDNGPSNTIYTHVVGSDPTSNSPAQTPDPNLNTFGSMSHSGYFKTTDDLASGVYTLKLIVTDSQGNSVEEEFTFELRTPTLAFDGDVRLRDSTLHTSVTNPSIDVTFNTQETGFSFSCEVTPSIISDGTQYDSLTFSAAVPTPTFSFKLSDFNGNLNTQFNLNEPLGLNFECEDSNQNPIDGSGQYILKLDDTPPEFLGLSVQGPNPKLIFNRGNANYPTVEDNLVFKFGDTAETGGYECNYRVVNSDSRYTCSQTPVEVTFNSPATLQETNSIKMVNLGQEALGVALCDMDRNFASNEEIETSFTIEATCEDLAGNQASSSQRIDVGVDFTNSYLVNLELEVVSSDEARAIVTSVFDIPNPAFTMVDQSGIPVDVTFSATGSQEGNYYTYESPFSISGLTSGTYEYTVSATSNDNQVGSLTGTLDIDSTLPDGLSISVPGAVDGIVYGKSFSVIFSSSDENFRKVEVLEGSSVVFSHELGSNPEITGTSFIKNVLSSVFSDNSHSGAFETTNPLAPRDYTLTLRVTDTSGNKNEESITVTLDDSFAVIIEDSSDTFAFLNDKWVSRDSTPQIRFRTTQTAQSCTITPVGFGDMTSQASDSFIFDLGNLNGFELTREDRAKTIIVDCYYLDEGGNLAEYTVQKSVEMAFGLPDYVLESSEGFVLTKEGFKTDLQVTSVGAFRPLESCSYSINSGSRVDMPTTDGLTFTSLGVDFSAFRGQTVTVNIECQDSTRVTGPSKNYEIVISDAPISVTEVQFVASDHIIEAQENGDTLLREGVSYGLEARVNKIDANCEYRITDSGGIFDGVVNFFRNLFNIGNKDMVGAEEEPFIFNAQDVITLTGGDQKSLRVSCIYGPENNRFTTNVEPLGISTVTVDNVVIN